MSAVARMTQRLAVQTVQKRNKSIWTTVSKEATRAETWPFIVGMAITGYIVWGATPSSTSEYAKHSKFQQRLNGTFSHDHH
mmetsp:Transcript_3721/g.8194  ORF Transcript_3721/g.8194 Transcript_3721/m.8194 type:complete len:81 (+) Transcript_3721:28-270(+)